MLVWFIGFIGTYCRFDQQKLIEFVMNSYILWILELDE